MILNNGNKEWIGKIPENWQLKRLKYVLIQRNENNIPIKSRDILSLTAKQGVIPYSEKEGGGNKPKNNFADYKLAYPGDIVMNSMNILSGSVGISKYFGCVSPVYYMLKANKPNHTKYFYYLFANRTFQSSLLGIGNGILVKKSSSGKLNTIRMRVPIEKLNNLLIPVPKPDVQKSIIKLLDKKCGDIDQISQNIQQEIDTLKEYKESFITELLTQGIDNGEEKKESNIDWIGKINKNCEVIRLKFLLKEPLKYGANESGIDFNPDYPRYIRITDITSDSRLKTKGKLSLLPEQAEGYILKNNTILFARSGGTVGKSFLYKISMGKAAFAGYLISAVINENIVDPKWVYYFTKSSIYTIWVNMIFSRATIQNIGADKYAELPVVVNLNKKIQKKTLSLLDDKVHAINKIIQQKKKLLNDLEEFKQSLIYEYVTGKKQVPNVGEN